MVFVTIHLTLLTPFPWRSFIFAVNSRKQFWGLEPDYGRWQYWNKQHSGKVGVYWLARKYCHIFFCHSTLTTENIHLLLSGRESYILGLLPSNATSIQKCCRTQQFLYRGHTLFETFSLNYSQEWVISSSNPVTRWFAIDLLTVLNLFRLINRVNPIIFLCY